MKNKSSGDDKQAILDAINLAKFDGDKKRKKTLQDHFLQRLAIFIKKYPVPCWPNSKELQQCHQKLMKVSNRASLLAKTINNLDAHSLKLIGWTGVLVPSLSQRDWYLLPDFSFDGERMKAVMDGLEKTAKAAADCAPSPKHYRQGVHTKDLFVIEVAIIWEAANPSNKVTGYTDGKFIDFAERLYAVLYPNHPESEHSLARAIKRYAKTGNIRNAKPRKKRVARVP